MVRTLKNILRQDREKFVVPKSVQQAVPILAVWENGIFQIAKNKFARTYKFEDINYAVASREDQEAMFLAWFHAPTPVLPASGSACAPLSSL